MTEMYNLSIKMKREAKGNERALMFGHLPIPGQTREQDHAYIHEKEFHNVSGHQALFIKEE